MSELRSWKVSVPEEPADVSRVLVSDSFMGDRVVSRDAEGWWVDSGPSGTWFHRHDWSALLSEFGEVREVAEESDPTRLAIDQLRAIPAQARDEYLASLPDEVAVLVRSVLGVR